MAGEYVWDPLTPTEAATVMAAFPRPWWIAGGWAIDLHLGRETREHGDLDIAMQRGDEVQLPALLPGWDICIAEAGELTPWPGTAPLERPYHQFWIRREPGGPWTFEVLLEEHEGDMWRYRRSGDITAPLARLERRTRDGIPYLAPEIALLYKANGREPVKSEADFAAALPSLDAAARSWLRAAMEIAHAGHPWIARL